MLKAVRTQIITGPLTPGVSSSLQQPYLTSSNKDSILLRLRFTPILNRIPLLQVQGHTHSTSRTRTATPCVTLAREWMPVYYPCGACLLLCACLRYAKKDDQNGTRTTRERSFITPIAPRLFVCAPSLVFPNFLTKFMLLASLFSTDNVYYTRQSILKSST